MQNDNGVRLVIVYTDEDGVYIADVPSMPGCVSDGATLEGALENVKDAIRGWVAVSQGNGDPIPPDISVTVATVHY